MNTIEYAGKVVAVCDGELVFLSSQIAVLEADHPRRRFIEHLCADYLEHGRGMPEKACKGHHAERHARSSLIDDAAFRACDSLPDAELAERFNVPLEQIALKREDVLHAPLAWDR